MADKITLEIVTPLGPALTELVDDLSAPSTSGEFGVLPGHLPLLAAIRTGLVTYRVAGEERCLAVSNGFIEIKDDRALILTDKVMTKDAVDPVRVRLELKEVDEKLTRYAGAPGAPEWQLLVAAELWAAVQLELYGDPPIATQRPFEQYGPPSPPEEPDVPRDSPVTADNEH